MGEGDLLLSANGTEIVRYFGRKLKIIVPKQIEVFGESCLQECTLLEQVYFWQESKLRRICNFALSKRRPLKSISIPASVEEIGDAAFKDCVGLEPCEIPEDSVLKMLITDIILHSENCCNNRRERFHNVQRIGIMRVC
jgi:hypothetical protein